MHKFTLGRYTRTNYLTPEHSSSLLLNNEVLVSAKTFISHEYTIDKRDNQN